MPENYFFYSEISTVSKDGTMESRARHFWVHE